MASLGLNSFVNLTSISANGKGGWQAVSDYLQQIRR
jgi:hypothetical protein